MSNIEPKPNTADAASPNNAERERIRQDILFKLTGDSYGDELYVDNKAKHIADDLIDLVLHERQAIIAEIEAKAPKKAEQVQPSFMSTTPWPPINEVEAVNARDAQWRSILKEVSCEKTHE